MITERVTTLIASIDHPINHIQIYDDLESSGFFDNIPLYDPEEPFDDIITEDDWIKDVLANAEVELTSEEWYKRPESALVCLKSSMDEIRCLFTSDQSTKTYTETEISMFKAKIIDMWKKWEMITEYMNDIRKR